MKERIPLFKTHTSELSRIRVDKVLQSGWLGAGPEVEKFEKVFKEKFNTPTAIMTTSCTAALHLACESVKEPLGSVITTPLTFVSTNMAIRMANMNPVFVDIDLKTGNILPEAIEKSMNGRTIAIMVVHYGGLPADIGKILEMADDNGIPVIQDAAHAMGAKYHGRWIGSFGEFICFSMNSKKNVAAGDGGVLVVPMDLEESVKRMRWFGITKETYQRDKEIYSWKYDIPVLGFKYDPTDIIGTLARSELENVDWYRNTRAKFVKQYRRELENIPGITLLKELPHVRSGHHLMVILAEHRDDLGKKLNENGIDFGVHYIPNNCFAAFGGSKKICRDTTPNAWEFYSRCMSLPLHMYLDTEQVEYICSVIKSGW